MDCSVPSHIKNLQSWLMKCLLIVETNNCYAHVAQYLNKQKQLGNEMFSVNRMQHKKH